MNQLKGIMTRLHGENKSLLTRIYVDKHVHIEAVSSSEQSVEDERIYVYHDLSFRFAGTGLHHPERMNLFVFIPVGILEEGEYKAKEESYIPWEDYLLRMLAPAVNQLSEEWENNRKDSREKARCEGQRVNSCILRRNGLVFDPGRQAFVLRLLFHMPLVNGVGINGKSGFRAVRSILEIIELTLGGLDRQLLQKYVSTYQRQREIQQWLQKNHKVAFIADGSILPRAGESELPMQGAIPFISPDSLRETLTFSDGTSLTGMVIPEGVTVITGGGYSGKSTLLDALEQGIYHHIPGDGREYVISLSNSTKIYAEDGRPISEMDFSLFFNEVSNGPCFRHFSTSHASGSVSQAANILEAIYAGSSLLLIDEDTSATNFMIRDNLIRQLVEKEPIVPFTDRVRSIYGSAGVSTILVIGGSGEYLQHGDLCLLMEDYKIKDVTEEAERLAGKRNKTAAEELSMPLLQNRYLSPAKSDFTFLFSRCVSVDHARYIQIDNCSADVTRLTALGSVGQLHTLAYLLTLILNGRRDEPVECGRLARELTTKLFSPEISEHIQADNYQFTLWLEEIRPMDLLAAFFRMRGWDEVKEK